MNHKPSIRRRPLVLRSKALLRRVASGYDEQAIRVAASPRHLHRLLAQASDAALPLGSGRWQATICPETSGRRGNHSLISHSPEETRGIAGSLIEKFSRDAVIALYGELGSGKTCFVQGIAIALGIRQAVTSPTFKIVNEYIGICPLYHIDLYRIHSPDEVLAFGFEEYLEMEGIKAIEWAERAGDLIPTSAIRLSFEIMPNPEQRRIRIISEQ